MVLKEKMREIEAPVFVFSQDQGFCLLHHGPLTLSCTDITCSFSLETNTRGSWKALPALPCPAVPSTEAPGPFP